MSAAAAAAASAYWRVAGMSYLKYSNLCAEMLRASLKEPFKSQAKLKEVVYFRSAVWKDGKPEKQVVFTIGPACQDVDTLCSILEAGATAARIDLTWGNMDFHKKSLSNLQAAIKKTRNMCAVMLDSIGREMFVKRKSIIGEDGWPYHDEIYHVEENQRVTLTGRDVPATNTVWPLNYSRFNEMAAPNDYIYVSRYLITGADAASLYLKVVEIQGQDVICEAQAAADLDGLLTVYHMERNRYGHDENKQNDLPILSEKDEADIKELGKHYEIDFLCLSHTRCKEDVLETREFLDSNGLGTTKLVAKIESKYGLARFKGILNLSDAIMISRGNLGLDVPVEKIALIQKHIISSCNLVGKPVLVTRVVDTMTTTPRPTRAEATDIANAILDGADGFLLGAETLRGLYPVETINVILHISKQAEKFFDETMHFDYLMQEAVRTQATGSLNGRSESVSNLSVHSGASYLDLTNAIKTMATFNADVVHDDKKQEEVYTGSPYLSKLESIASSAVRAASKVNASLLVVYTHSGQTAKLVAKYRPKMPILTLVVPQLVSDSLSWKLEGRGTARQCLITRGLLPMLAAPRSSIDSILEESVMAAAGMGIVKQDDHVVCIQRIHDDFCLKIVSVNDLVKTFNRAAESFGPPGSTQPILEPLAE